MKILPLVFGALLVGASSLPAADVVAPLLPGVSRKAVWRRVRLSIEYGYTTDGMLNEEDRIPRSEIFRDAARILSMALLDLQRRPD